VTKRTTAFVLALIGVILLAPARDAHAHASLVRAQPADGAVLPASPSALALTFNEPVAPLVLRLIGPAGQSLALGRTVGENATITINVPATLQRGTHVLSWRVISADGHPVGGTLMFSVGAPSPRPATGHVANPAVHIGIWAARVALYVGLFLGVGGAFFRAWIADGRARAAPWLMAFLVGGLLAAPLSVSLQGLDALDFPLAALQHRIAWEAGIQTSYGRTAITAAVALFAGLFAMTAKSLTVARAFALVGLLAVGLALALSGHATTTGPISAAAVFLHAVCVAFWTGSLLPLYAGVRAAPDAVADLKRFSRVIPLAVAVLILSGTWLVLVQLDRVEALWSTDYGRVLAAKLVAVVVLLGLAAANRFRLVPKVEAGDAAAVRRFASSLALELIIALSILGLVALWRFTPPPRALAAPAATSLHLHGDKAMAEIAIEREKGQGARAILLVLDGEFRPLAAKEVTLVLANPAAGIEPMRRPASPMGDNRWRVDDLLIPVAGRWMLRVEILISDFDKVSVEDAVMLPRAP
jgi:copper transport protein